MNTRAQQRKNSFGHLGTALRAALLLTAVVVLAAPVLAGPVCEQTARDLRVACFSDLLDDFFSSQAVCRNFSDKGERMDCRNEARFGRSEGRGECHDVFEARVELCDDLGENRYDPDFDGADFTMDFDNRNPYFPLAPGNRWVYEAEDETIEVEVLDKTKLIDGVTCIVVNDLVSEDGQPIEDTDDWYGQNLDGGVHYCGELARDFELFDGDDPEEAELIAIDGSFKAGRDGAKSGILMQAFPMPGDIYRQEWAVAEAEDVAEVLSNSYSYGDDPELDEFVPQELADLFCDGDCVVTRDTTPLEPDVSERKYYAPGVGLFLEVDEEEGGTSEIVECNVSDLCDEL